MADRTAAEIFGRAFELLSEKPTQDSIDLAEKLWENTNDYDFTADQMGCDGALLILGLARVDPDNLNWVIYNY